jgi:hypothetical protein
MPAPDVYKSTIYHNLDELERLNVVDRTRLGHGPATYHLASATHGHLVCERCSSMTEVPDEIFASLTEIARTRTDSPSSRTASPLSAVSRKPAAAAWCAADLSGRAHMGTPEGAVPAVMRWPGPRADTASLPEKRCGIYTG